MTKIRIKDKYFEQFQNSQQKISVSEINRNFISQQQQQSFNQKYIDKENNQQPKVNPNNIQGRSISSDIEKKIDNDKLQLNNKQNNKNNSKEDEQNQGLFKYSDVNSLTFQESNNLYDEDDDIHDGMKSDYSDQRSSYDQNLLEYNNNQQDKINSQKSLNTRQSGSSNNLEIKQQNQNNQKFQINKNKIIQFEKQKQNNLLQRKQIAQSLNIEQFIDEDKTNTINLENNNNKNQQQKKQISQNYSKSFKKSEFDGKGSDMSLYSENQQQQYKKNNKFYLNHSFHNNIIQKKKLTSSEEFEKQQQIYNQKQEQQYLNNLDRNSIDSDEEDQEIDSQSIYNAFYLQPSQRVSIISNSPLQNPASEITQTLISSQSNKKLTSKIQANKTKQSNNCQELKRFFKITWKVNKLSNFLPLIILLLNMQTLIIFPGQAVFSFYFDSDYLLQWGQIYIVFLSICMEILGRQLAQFGQKFNRNLYFLIILFLIRCFGFIYYPIVNNGTQSEGIGYDILAMVVPCVFMFLGGYGVTLAFLAGQKYLKTEKQHMIFSFLSIMLANVGMILGSFLAFLFLI